MKTYLEVIKYYYDSGHELASHTYEHLNLAGKSEVEVRRQMNAQSDVIFAATGRRYIKVQFEYLHKHINLLNFIDLN